jgi:uncharacterized protein (TIGR02246 family)
MSAADAPVETALARYAQAVRDKDVAAFAALYAEDVQVFDMWGAWSLHGIDAWRGMADSWFGSLGDEQVVVTWRDVQASVADALAIGHATLTYTAVSAAGQTLRTLDNRITLALRRQAGEWKIFHEHTSAPIEHATLKAILTRERA